MERETLIAIVITAAVAAGARELFAWVIPKSATVARLAARTTASWAKRNLDFIVTGMYFVAFLVNLIGFWGFPETRRDKPVTHETVQMQILLASSTGIWGGLSLSALVRALLARKGQKVLLADGG